MDDLKVPAAWQRDCGSKWDYDGRLVSLSTRYWGDRTAKATIYLGSTQDAYYDDAVPLIEKEFSGQTREEVHRAVELWAKEQFSRIANALRREFAATPLQSGAQGGKA